MKRIGFLIFLSFIFSFSCKEPSRDPDTGIGTGIVVETDNNGENGSQDRQNQTSEADFGALISLFEPKDLPVAFDNSFDPDDESIDPDLQHAFFKNIIDNRRAVNRYDLSDEYIVLCTVEQPLEDVRYVVLNSFSPEGKLISNREIAGNDGAKLDGFIDEDKIITILASEGEGMNNKSTGKTFLKMDKEGFFKEISAKEANRY